MSDAIPATDEAPLLVSTQGRLRILTLNRPERLNALTPELHRLLRAAVREAAEDADIGAVALTGAGRAFCSGGDVKRGSDDAVHASRPQTVEERADALRHHGETTLTLSRMPKPTIALVNGAPRAPGLRSRSPATCGSHRRRRCSAPLMLESPCPVT